MATEEVTLTSLVAPLRDPCPLARATHARRMGSFINIANSFINAGRSAALANVRVEGRMTVIWLRLPHGEYPMPEQGFGSLNNCS